MAETKTSAPSLTEKNVTMAAATTRQTDAASIYQVHVHQVSRWAERLAGPNLDVEDIVHEVFIIAYERMSTFAATPRCRPGFSASPTGSCGTVAARSAGGAG